MKQFLFFAIAYFCLSVVLVLLTRDSGVDVLKGIGATSFIIIDPMARFVGGFIAAGLIAMTVLKFGSRMGFVRAVLIGFTGTVILQAGFLLFKTSMPYIVPFYADAALANWDRVLHGGVDPWRWTHLWADYLPMDLLVPVYLHVWIFPAFFLPIFLAVTDRDAARVKRTMIMYCLGWILIGNVMALAGMSAGPVFYDRLFGGDVFAALTASIAQTPALADYFGVHQDNLWVAYAGTDQSVGFGISAFPSVHLAMSMVTCLYLFERSRLLGIIGVGFVAVIMFLSVYSGYHYALDGYVSIAVMWGVWAVLRRRAAAPRTVALPDGQLA